jgi:hypothetical protein
MKMKTITMSEESAKRFQKAIDNFMVYKESQEDANNLRELGGMIDQIVIDYARGSLYV